jgi:hypothetical protein
MADDELAAIRAARLKELQQQQQQQQQQQTAQVAPLLLLSLLTVREASECRCPWRCDLSAVSIHRAPVAANIC